MTSRRTIQALSAIVLVGVLYVALAYALYNGLTQHVLGANDFFSRWMGARALFLRGENPYSETVTREIQWAMYGRLARPDEDQVAFAYPLYAAFVAAPLVGLPYAQAQALWMALLILLVVASVLILIRLNQFAPSPLSLVGILLGVLVSYPVGRGIFLGQYAIVAFFLLVVAFWAITHQHDFLGGVCLMLATVKPQPLVFFVPTILFWAIQQRRWRIVGGAILASGVLVGSAMLWVPTWLGDFMQALKNYATYIPIGPPAQTLIELLAPPTLRGLGTLILSSILVGWMVWSVWRTRHERWQPFCSTLDVVALVTVWTAGRIGSPDQILLAIPWLGWLNEGWRRGVRVQVILALTTLLLVPWLVFGITLRGDAEHRVVTLVLPILTFVAYLVHRYEER